LVENKLKTKILPILKEGRNEGRKWDGGYSSCNICCLQISLTQTHTHDYTTCKKEFIILLMTVLIFIMNAFIILLVVKLILVVKHIFTDVTYVPIKNIKCVWDDSKLTYEYKLLVEWYNYSVYNNYIILL